MQHPSFLVKRARWHKRVFGDTGPNILAYAIDLLRLVAREVWKAGLWVR